MEIIDKRTGVTNRAPSAVAGDVFACFGGEAYMRLNDPEDGAWIWACLEDGELYESLPSTAVRVKATVTIEWPG